MIIRKKLIMDISAEQIRNVTELLKENKITYDMKTVTAQWSGSRALNAHLGESYLQSPNGGGNYIYTVYVRPRDYDRAKKIIN